MPDRLAADPHQTGTETCISLKLLGVECLGVDLHSRIILGWLGAGVGVCFRLNDGCVGCDIPILGLVQVARAAWFILVILVP